MRSVIILICSIFVIIIITEGLIIVQQGIAIGELKRTVTYANDNVITLKKQLEQEKKSAKEILITSSSSNENIQAISGIISEAANTINGDRSIYFKNLLTDESVVLNSEKKYYMASLYKVILTLFILEEVKKGAIRFNDALPSHAITIKEALNKIVTESNNEYAEILAEKYGWKHIEEVMRAQLGIQFSFGSDLSIDIKSVGILFEKVALALDIKDDESSYVLNLLKDQQRVSKLPKYLPKHIYSHNKTGEFEDYSHDAGIFYTPRANYILIFMSKTPNPANTNEIMAKMSHAIYITLNQ